MASNDRDAFLMKACLHAGPSIFGSWTLKK